jgi:hypothetical protein
MAEQLTLPLEYVMPEHYTIELRKGDIGDMRVLRSHEVRDADDAVNLIDGLRDSALQRHGVTWQHPEVEPDGTLYGMDGAGIVYMISVVPPLGALV